MTTETKNIDVLNLEWAATGRDRGWAFLICEYLRSQGLNVLERGVFNYRYELWKHDPTLLFAASAQGSAQNYRVVRDADALGIPVISVTAEGNYSERKLIQQVWGHNQEKDYLEKINIQWSTRARDLALSIAPQLADKLVVCGGIGFDRYKIYRFEQKEELFKRLGRKYGQVIGFGGFTFEQFVPRVHTNYPVMLKRFGKDVMPEIDKNRTQVNAILKEMVSQNPEILFVLKRHPGSRYPDYSEFYGLDQYENTYILQNEHEIGDCISWCDIWGGYDTTTCLEAWLLGKPTFLINPSIEDFPRSNVFLGSPIYKTASQLSAAIKNYYNCGELDGFRDLENQRKKIVTDAIQWDDGKNHLRAAYVFEKMIEKYQQGKRETFSSKWIAKGLAQNVLFTILRQVKLPGKRFSDYRNSRTKFRLDEYREYAAKFSSMAHEFWSENELTRVDKEELKDMNRKPFVRQGFV